MDEKMIYQNMSQLVFNAVMRGETRDKAVKDAEELMREIANRSRVVAREIAQSQGSATSPSKDAGK